MKRTPTIISVLLSVFLVSVAAAGQLQQTDLDAIKDLVAAHDQALTEKDLDAVMATYAPDDRIVMLGTGPGERWLGKEEIRDAYAHFFNDFDKGAQKFEYTWRTGGIEGNMAWVFTMGHVTLYLKNVKKEFALNISAVLMKVDGKWYFQAMHFSNLTGGAE